jgi:hypothetical protein
VDASGDVNWFFSMEIDPYGNVYIAYHDLANNDLKLATTTIPEPGTLAVLLLGAPALFLRRRR